MSLRNGAIGIPQDQAIMNCFHEFALKDSDMMRVIESGRSPLEVRPIVRCSCQAHRDQSGHLLPGSCDY